MTTSDTRLSCLAHQINDSCDCRCQFCQVWRRTGERSLRLEQIQALHRDARELGIGTYIVYGGEPLLRPDLPDILRSAKDAGMRVFLCSNSGRLEQRVDDIASLIDLYLISIDGDAEVHDELRGHPGLHAKALRGLAKLKGRGPEVRIWSHLHSGNVDSLGAVAQLAAELDVRVDFFPTHSTGRYVNDLALSSAARAAAFEQVAALKAAGYPIQTSTDLLRVMGEAQPFRCHWPATTAYVAHGGELRSCERLDLPPLGNVQHTSLVDIVRAPAFAQAARELESCNACALPCVMSMAELTPVSSL